MRIECLTSSKLEVGKEALLEGEVARAQHKYSQFFLTLIAKSSVNAGLVSETVSCSLKC